MRPLSRGCRVGMKPESMEESIRNDPLVVNGNQEINVMLASGSAEHRGHPVFCQVNTHNSILNVGEENDEEDDEEGTLFHQGKMIFDETTPNSSKRKKVLSHNKHIPESPSQSSKSSCDLIHIASTPKDSSLLDQMTESLTERLCFSKDGHQVSNSACVGGKDGPKDVACSQDYQRLLADDILELLGCATHPDKGEMKKVWKRNQANFFSNMSPNRPRRYSLRERAMRIHRLKTERAMLQERTALSSSPTSVLYPINRVGSMDNSPSFFASPKKNRLPVGRSLKPILRGQNETKVDFIETEDDLGYDSDPGELSKRSASTFGGDLNEETPPLSLSSSLQSTKSGDIGTAVSPNTANNDQFVPEVEHSIKLFVHETFNCSWTLTWHPENSSKGISRPRCISVWIERGTRIQNKRSLLEPKIMWREAFQADLPKRKLNQSTRNPYSIRFLNLCRILEAPINLGTQYPLSRPSCCLILQTGSPKQEFLFEAASPALRDDIIRCWKLCVARFASLAATDDMFTIYEEFFTPMVFSNMTVL